MNLTLAQMKLMQAKGLTLADVIEVAEAGEVAPARSANAERQARYRERNKPQPVTETVTEPVTSNVTDNVTDNVTRNVTPFPLNDPQSLTSNTEGNLNPYPYSPFQKRKLKSKASLAKPDYDGDFEMAWREYPRRAGTSKAEAYEAWQRLPEADRESLFDGTLAFAGKVNTEHIEEQFIPHFAVFIRQRRFDTFLEAAE